MPVPIQREALFDLRDANVRLQHWLDAFQLQLQRAMPAPPEQMSGVLSDLLQVGSWLRMLVPGPRSADLEQELALYRQNVERLQEVLPAIQRQLLLEKARLEAERMRVQSAAEWVRSSRQTL